MSTGGAPTTVSASVKTLAAAARKAANEGTVHTSYTFEAKQGSTTVKGSGDGAFDLGSKTGQMSLDMHSGDQSFQMDEVLAMPVIYMRSSVLGLPQLDDGSYEWLKVDLQAQGKKMGIDFSSLTNSNPTDTLTQLGKYGADVETVGTEDVRGVSTTHYRATLDMAEAAAKEKGAAADSLRKVALLLDDTKVPVDIWIDDTGLTRRFSQSFSEHVPGQSDSMKLSMTYELYDYGAPVTIKVPDPANVVDSAKISHG
jgi:hypothetical protein